jgi:hypothetical protein
LEQQPAVRFLVDTEPAVDAAHRVYTALCRGDDAQLHDPGLPDFGGLTATVLADNMKIWVVEGIDGQLGFHLKMLDFANYVGFVPRVCHSYGLETKCGNESTIRYIKASFWPGIKFTSPAVRARPTVSLNAT